MMRRTLLLLFSIVVLGASAQEVQQTPTLAFGYLSYDAVMSSMPEYAQMQSSIDLLRSQYEAELKRVEDDFNGKYEEFLDGQAAFPKTILQKRQSELQELLNRNIAFKKQSQQLLEKAEAEAKAPLQQKLQEALAKVGSERGLLLIVNTDANATPWINTLVGIDITEDVKAQLK